MIKERFLKTFVIISLVVLSATLAFAQGGTTRLSGVVTDKNGGLVGGAKVSATNEATGVTVTQVTTSGGIYSFASMAPGKSSPSSLIRVKSTSMQTLSIPLPGSIKLRPLVPTSSKTR